MIGAAANEASRVESMTKVLGVDVVVSKDFADGFAGELTSLGHHNLRGVRDVRELFTIPDTTS